MSSLVAEAALAADSTYSVDEGGGERRGRFFVAGDSGARLQIAPGMALFAEPRTELRVMASTSRVWLGADGIHDVHVVLVKEGHVRAEVAEEVAKAESEAPRALALWSAQRRLAVVTGGRAELVVRDGAKVVANTGGRVLVASGASWETLRPGYKQRRVHGAAAPAVPLLPEPVISLKRRIASAFRGPASLPVEWKPVKGARSYRVLLRREGKPQVFAERTVSAPERSIELQGLRPGKYVVEVVPTDGDGILGNSSKASVAHVLGAELPRGAYVARNGTLRLAPQQRARITHVQGLEMAYGAGDRWTAATERVRMYRERPTQIRYRVPGTAQSHVLRLVPQAVRADILIGPKNPEFPRDDVHVAVRLIDEYGGSARQQIEPKIVVTAGIEPLDLEWEERGGFHYAKVPPVRGAGPWVIRVDVFGPDGRELGHDFIEVAAGDVPTEVRLIPVASGSRDPAASVASAEEARARGAH